MKFDVTAVIKEIGAIETVGQKGFQKRNLILSEVNGQYENLVCVEFSGEKLQDPERYQVGQSVKVGGFINCNEWQGKYFTSLKGSFVQNAEAEQTPVPAMGQEGYQAPQPQGVDLSMAPPTQPYQAPQQAIPVPQPQIPITTPVPVQQPVAQPHMFDPATGQPIPQSDIPF